MENRIVNIPACRPYEVIIGEGILQDIGSLVKKLKIKDKSKVYIITDDIVHGLYFQTIQGALCNSGYSVYDYIIPHGEQSKSLFVFGCILEDIAEKKITRSDIIIALGGGVVGDISGFAAAVYLRGIEYIQIPTTFLSAIDSSVGGKTAVNLFHGKNLVGAFKQPLSVLFDIDVLNTLSDEIFADGTAEAIKYGVLKSADLFDKLSRHNRAELMDFMQDIVVECVSIKGGIVERDEYDTGERQLLNLGHTIGHGIEQCSSYSITHGKAVAAGMAIMSKGTVKANLVPQNDVYEKICKALELHSLPSTSEFTAEELYNAALSDKKRSGGFMNIIVPIEIGNCEIVKIPVEQCLEIIKGGLDEQGYNNS